MSTNDDSISQDEQMEVDTPRVKSEIKQDSTMDVEASESPEPVENVEEDEDFDEESLARPPNKKAKIEGEVFYLTFC